MSDNPEYGRLTKRIVFTENDHRHAQLIIKLKHDGMGQSEFFRSLITAYLAGDERIQSYVDEVSQLSKKKKNHSAKLKKEGTQKLSDFGFTDGEIDNIFDLIEEEHPDL